MKRISMFRVKGLKILGRVCKRLFFVLFSGNKYNFFCFSPFKMHKIVFFSKKLKQIKVSPECQVTLNTGIITSCSLNAE